jgi:hypothetical protein
MYESVSKIFWTGRLEQMVQLSATRCSCIAILWVSLMIFTTITLCVASQRLFIVVVVVVVVVVVYFVIDSVRKLWIYPRIADRIDRHFQVINYVTSITGLLWATIWWRMWKKAAGAYFEALSEHLSQNRQTRGSFSNLGPPEYETGAWRSNRIVKPWILKSRDIIYVVP